MAGGTAGLFAASKVQGDTDAQQGKKKPHLWLFVSC